jgi:hypothetical protein
MWNWIDLNNHSTYNYTPGKLGILLSNGNHDLSPESNLAAPRMVQSIYGGFAVKPLVSASPSFVYQGTYTYRFC